MAVEMWNLNSLYKLGLEVQDTLETTIDHTFKPTKKKKYLHKKS